MQACRAEQCHHNITNGTLDFSVLLPPPYYREIWDYKNASVDSIQEAISIFSCPKALTNKNKKILIKKALMLVKPMVGMTQSCWKSIALSPKLSFKTILEVGTFQED